MGKPEPRRTAASHTGEVLTAVDIEREITRLSDALEEDVHDLRELARTAAENEASYKAAYAKARLRARAQGGSGPSGRCTGDEADDRAMEQTFELFHDHLVATALYQSARDAMRARMTQMDALRTISANIRAVT